MRDLACMVMESKLSDKPTKMDPEDKENVVELNDFIDTWRIVDTYDMRWYTDYKKYPDSVFVNKEDFENAKKKAKNPKGIDVCLRSHGMMRGSSRNVIR